MPNDASQKSLHDMVVLADDLALQAATIAAAYADGRREAIDRALFSVVDVRRLKVTGILDWFREGDDWLDEGGRDETAPSDSPDAPDDADPSGATSG